MYQVVPDDLSTQGMVQNYVDKGWLIFWDKTLLITYIKSTD